MMISLISFAATLVCFGLTAEGVFIGGRHTQIDYNKCGLWNDAEKRRGFVMDDCCPVDVTWPGTPWQQLSISYRVNSVTRNFAGNTNSGCTYVVKDTQILNEGREKVGIRHTIETDHLVLIKNETWDFRAKALIVEFEAKYPSEKCACSQLENVAVSHGVDPDVDYYPFGTYSTYNDVHQFGDSANYAEAVGPISCHTLAYGHCSRPRGADYSEQAGFTRWSTSPFLSLEDPNHASQDNTIHYSYNRKTLQCDQSVNFRFVVTWDRTANEARQNFINIYPRVCTKCKPLVFITRPTSAPCRNICPCSQLSEKCDCNRKKPFSSFTRPGGLTPSSVLEGASKRRGYLSVDEEIVISSLADVSQSKTCPLLSSTALTHLSSLPNFRPIVEDYNRKCRVKAPGGLSPVGRSS